MSAAASNDATFNVVDLIVAALGRLPTFDEAREWGMKLASLAAAQNVGAFYNKPPQIPAEWATALEDYNETEDSLRFARGGLFKEA